MLVTALHVYPVKSARGVALPHAQVGREGLEHDRRWMVIGPDGGKLSPPRHRGMLHLTAAPAVGGGVMLTAPGRVAGLPRSTAVEA